MQQLNFTSNTQSFISTLMNSGLVRDRITSIALARVIAASLPPLQPEVPDFNAAYNQVIRAQFQGLLDSVVSVLPVDVLAVEELVRQFYRFRFLQYSEKNTPLVYDSPTPLLSFFRIDVCFSADDLKLIEQNSQRLTPAMLKFGIFIEELKNA